MKVQEIFEAISDEDVDMLKHMGYFIIDSKEVGEYTLHLCRMPSPIPGPSGEDIEYEIALNKHDYSFTDFDSQFTKYKDPKNVQNILRARNKFIEIVRKWKNAYGTLAVGSYNPKNVRVYHKLLSRSGIKVTPITDNDGIPYFFI